MKFFNLISLSLLVAVASAAAVPEVEGTVTNDAATPVNNLDDKRDHCGQVCLNNTGCGGKCPKCDMKSLTCKKA
ncbi:UPF0499 protein NFIA_054990 [Aspergillus lentulus]|uniref:UPF0499 protein NFIA_054990 n=1 Tax=Aspergillus lentulus TaxID=293939 RepID=A0AAN4PAW3_ASPLE|nr:UPF0499 protein NFIA_054990 [Aspergillus lentulus]